MAAIPLPDHSDRPFRMTCEHVVQATTEEVFAAFTNRLDRWFAQPGTLFLSAEPGQPYFFYNRDEWGRDPHYGRILDLKNGELVEMTWITGNGTEVGTQGAETILRVELEPVDDATRVLLTHEGFVSQASCDSHAENWPLALDILDEALA